MCQKAFGNAFAPLVTARGLRFTRGQPARFRSSNKVSRGFCRECGTPLTYEPDGAPPEIAIATLDDPGDVAPVVQLNVARRFRWVDEIGRLRTLTPEEEARFGAFFEGIVSNQHPDEAEEA
jgi:hypothetical protein